jgi:hypothetical protein
MQALRLIVPPLLGKGVHIERYISGGWTGPLPQLAQEKRHFLAAFLLQLPRFRRLLVTVGVLGIPLEEE